MSQNYLLRSPLPMDLRHNVDKSDGSQLPPSPNLSSPMPPRDQLETEPLLRLDSQGADVTYPVYRAINKRKDGLRRSQSDVSLESRTDDPFGVAHIRQMVAEPQGFRRWHLTRMGEVRDGTGGAAYTRAFVRVLLDLAEEEEYSDEEVEEVGIDQLHEPAKGLSFTETYFAMMKAIIGSGVLVLPSTFRKSGLLLSLGVLVLISVLTGYCIVILMDTRGKQTSSFPEIGRAAFGTVAERMVQVSMMMFQGGLIVMYHIFVSQTLKTVLEGMTDCAPWTVSLTLTELIFLHAAIQTFVGWIRRVRTLARIAIFADILIVAGVASILGRSFVVMQRSGITQDIVYVSFSGLGLAVGTSVSAFEGICAMIPLIDAMEDPQRFSWSLSLALGCCALFFGMIGTVGYITFGDEVQSNVLLNFGSVSSVAMLVMTLYTLAIACSVCMQALPAFRVIESVFRLPSGKHNPRAKWIKNALRGCFIFMTAMLANQFPDELDSIISLIGGIAGAPLGFVYPPLFHWKLSRERGTATTRSQVRDIVLCVVGLLLSGLATVVALRSWGSAPPPPDRCLSA
eukprot:Hpha_TRINITY_DN16156_c7_g3::TRINITY_DN16156_c7_g3_i1::g.3515::m.3515/K14209/SLC36A, PAT; solute carrier family 36 (proton-coupled amino acid transporter)